MITEQIELHMAKIQSIVLVTWLFVHINVLSHCDHMNPAVPMPVHQWQLSRPSTRRRIQRYQRVISTLQMNLLHSCLSRCCPLPDKTKR